MAVRLCRVYDDVTSGVMWMKKLLFLTSLGGGAIETAGGCSVALAARSCAQPCLSFELLWHKALKVSGMDETFTTCAKSSKAPIFRAAVWPKAGGRAKHAFVCLPVRAFEDSDLLFAY